ncbi:MAG TPA: OmpH family outer membrane protein [Myxococcaceae bacterium]|nr:OmpH family outer membrane protein [Myxococcaceae bacterium]
MSLRSLIAGAIAALPLLLPTVARAELKIGYVDLQRALLEVEEGRAAKAKLQGVLDSKQKEIDKEQEGLRKEKELLDKQASAMSEETRVSKQTELQKKLFDLAQRWEKGKQEMANRERTELQGIFQKMDPIIASIAQREGFTLVFEKTDSGLVYAPQSLDLTNELVRLYNDQHKGGKGTAAPALKSDAPKSDAPKKTTVASDPKATDVPKQ